MTYKTDRLVELFPDAYAARERDSVLYQILDAIGAELIAADERIKYLLKSHWVRYAEGAALDGLGAIYGVSRRTLHTGQLESDAALRQRLQSTVPLFTGGGTVAAIEGAVRSALGLPFNLEQLKLPAEFRALRDEIEQLVVVREFSPKGERVLERTIEEVTLDSGQHASQLVITLDPSASAESQPRIEWTFDRGSGYRLSAERLDSAQGFRSIDHFILPPGRTIVFTADANQRLRATVDGVECADAFVNLDGTRPALLPQVPAATSHWRFRAQSGLFDVAAFDGDDRFDLPQFHVTISRLIFEILTFDVEVPFFLQQAVVDLKRRYGYPGEIFVFEGIPLEHIQEVVDQTRAAGVRGNVHFYLRFLDDHQQHDRLTADLATRWVENAAVRESLLVADSHNGSEVQEMREHLTLAGVFDISGYDGTFGFL